MVLEPAFYVSNTFQYILRSPFSFDRWWDTPFIKMDELRIWNLWVTVQCSEISDTTLFSWSPQNPSRYSLRSSPKKTQFAAAKISTFQPNSVNPSIWFIPISQDADGSRLLEKLKELCLGLRFSPRNHQRPGGNQKVGLLECFWNPRNACWTVEPSTKWKKCWEEASKKR